MSGAESIDRLMHPLFQAEEGSSILTSAIQLRFVEIHQALARRLNRRLHSRFAGIDQGGARVCYGAGFGGLWYAVAIWANPSSPKLPQTSWLMLKRWAIADDAPRNSGSRMMAWMVRDLRGRFPAVDTLVSYSDPSVHDGALYRACGWTEDGTTRRAGILWHNRPRRHTANEAPQTVTRWIKRIRKQKAVEVQNANP